VARDDCEGPWAFRDPRRTHPGRAVDDDDSAAVLDQAAEQLTVHRSPMLVGDCLAHLHALVSLRAQIQARLPEVVAGARDQDHTWRDIAGQLGLTAAEARRRFTPTVNPGNETEAR
jgi:hypothetical protein